VSRWLAIVAFIVMPAAGLAFSACSPATKHQVLSFLLDGVPPLETPGAASTQQAGEPGGEVVADGAAATAVRYFPHAPYRENRCDGCHDMNRGELVQPLERGLCRSCHEPLVAKLRYVHGPVAVDACTECHHYHTSPFPALLLAEPVPTCTKCHDVEDLSKEEYHADIETRACTECHDPHGGDDRFFLKRSTP
jgi:predicted CXXCH cytochrome family protein